MFWMLAVHIITKIDWLGCVLALWGNKDFVAINQQRNPAYCLNFELVSLQVGVESGGTMTPKEMNLQQC